MGKLQHGQLNCWPCFSCLWVHHQQNNNNNNNNNNNGYINKHCWLLWGGQIEFKEKEKLGRSHWFLGKGKKSSSFQRITMEEASWNSLACQKNKVEKEDFIPKFYRKPLLVDFLKPWNLAIWSGATSAHLEEVFIL